MAFPLVPFVAGAVVGGLTAYFARDEKMRRDLSETTDEVSGKLKQNIVSLKDRLGRSSAKKEAPQSEAPAPKRTRRKLAPAKKAAAKAGRKAPTPRKKATRKAQPEPGAAE